MYVDDMVVKSKQEARHIEDLQGVFKVLRQHKLRLNAEKCTFSLGDSKFLGYLITGRGIKVNLNQIEVVKCLKPSSNQFISKFADRCWPFYQLLRKWKGFKWDEECEKAFQDLKEYLT